MQSNFLRSLFYVYLLVLFIFTLFQNNGLFSYFIYFNFSLFSFHTHIVFVKLNFVYAS